MCYFTNSNILKLEVNVYQHCAKVEIKAFAEWWRRRRKDLKKKPGSLKNHQIKKRIKRWIAIKFWLALINSLKYYVMCILALAVVCTLYVHQTHDVLLSVFPSSSACLFVAHVADSHLETTKCQSIKAWSVHWAWLGKPSGCLISTQFTTWFGNLSELLGICIFLWFSKFRIL